MDSFGSYLKDLRLEKEISIRELARLSGVSNPYLSQVETGKRGIPSPPILRKIARALNTSYEQMMKKAGYL